MFRIAVLCLVLATGCAAPQVAPKISLRELYGPRAALVPSPLSTAAKPKSKLSSSPKPARNSPELQAALIAFGARARQNRSTTPRGSPMPPAQVENWNGLVLALDEFLLHPAAETSSFDVIRARITLEAELELDARRYGDVDPALADALIHRVNALGIRMAEVRRLKVRTVERQLALAWPISPIAVTSLFGRRLHPIELRYRQHAGVDLAAEPGQLVSAAGPGVVTRAGNNGGYGNFVEIQHATGLITRYGHLSQILTEPGTRVRQGDPIGLAGSTGNSTGVHLHFEIVKNGHAIDPLEQMGRAEEPRPPVASL